MKHFGKLSSFLAGLVMVLGWMTFFAVPALAVDDPDRAKAVIYEAMYQEAAEIDLREFHISEEEAESFFLETVSSNQRPWFASPYVGQYSLSEEGMVISYHPSYCSKTMFDWALYEEKLDQIIEQTVFEGMSDWQIALSIHDYLTSHFTYDTTYEKSTAYELLINGTAVCAGYAQAYSDLLGLAGVKCYYVTSEAMDHAWCLVEIDGKLYHADPTWGDPLFDETGTNIHGYTSHSYFLKSDEYYATETVFLSPHFDWSPAYQAADPAFDHDTFWEYLDSPVIYLDSDHCIYKRTEGELVRIYLRTESEHTETVLCEVETPFYDRGDGTSFIYPASGLSVWEDKIYFCDMYHIYSVPLTGGTPTIVYSLDVDSEQKILLSVMVYDDQFFYSVMDLDENFEARSLLMPDHEHSYEITVAEPTCTEKGFTRYFCTGCKDEYLEQETEALGHSYSTEIVAPTCTEYGYSFHICANCSDSYSDTYVEPILHSWSEYLPDGNATCISDGTQTSRCRNCDASDTIPDPGSAAGHTWDDGVITKEPAPGIEGERTFTCFCGAVKTESIAALPEICHHESTRITGQKKATCLEGGYTGDLVCTECEEIVEAGSAIEPSGHIAITDPYIAATCTETGLTEGQHCGICGQILTPQVVLQASGHGYGEWEETTPPTATSEGESKRICQTCGQTETQKIDKLVNPFTDVHSGDYFETSVLWAVKNQITNGITPTTFKPQETCVRGQVVTFLWRAAGTPEPQSNRNSFVDISEEDYFYKAVLWAVEMGITNGIDATHFGPAQMCTRAQVATFLWRSMDQPKPKSAANSFKDVSAGEYYYNAVLWAVENEVTNGTGNGCFAPNDSCTRGQIVTFLYRALN